MFPTKSDTLELQSLLPRPERNVDMPIFQSTLYATNRSSSSTDTSPESYFESSFSNACRPEQEYGQYQLFSQPKPFEVPMFHRTETNRLHFNTPFRPTFEHSEPSFQTPFSSRQRPILGRQIIPKSPVSPEKHEQFFKQYTLFPTEDSSPKREFENVSQRSFLFLKEDKKREFESLSPRNALFSIDDKKREFESLSPRNALFSIDDKKREFESLSPRNALFSIDDKKREFESLSPRNAFFSIDDKKRERDSLSPRSSLFSTDDKKREFDNLSPRSSLFFIVEDKKREFDNLSQRSYLSPVEDKKSDFYSISPSSSVSPPHSMRMSPGSIGYIPQISPITNPIRFNKAASSSGLRDSKLCTFCKKNGERPAVYGTHTVKTKVRNKFVVSCPILRLHVCSTCGASGDNAHTITYCPVLRSNNNGKPLESTTITLKSTRMKSNGKKRFH